MAMFVAGYVAGMLITSTAIMFLNGVKRLNADAGS